LRDNNDFNDPVGDEPASGPSMMSDALDGCPSRRRRLRLLTGGRQRLGFRAMRAVGHFSFPELVAKEFRAAG